MRAAAVVCTYGRAALCDLLTCIDRQTLPLRTLVFVDGAPGLRFDELPELVDVCAGPRQASLGLVRRAAVEAAREEFELRAEDAVIMLDDDDFYSSRHYATTFAALDAVQLELGELGWTGGLAMGLTVEGGALELVHGEAGVGQQGTWAFTLGAYDAAGGYLDLPRNEDIALSHALKWSNCRAHHHVTHVRRHHAANISGRADFDREKVRALDRMATNVRPSTWSPELEQLEQWCQLQTLELATPRPARPSVPGLR